MHAREKIFIYKIYVHESIPKCDIWNWRTIDHSRDELRTGDLAQGWRTDRVSFFLKPKIK